MIIHVLGTTYWSSSFLSPLMCSPLSYWTPWIYWRNDSPCVWLSGADLPQGKTNMGTVTQPSQSEHWVSLEMSLVQAWALPQEPTKHTGSHSGVLGRSIPLSDGVSERWWWETTEVPPWECGQIRRDKRERARKRKGEGAKRRRAGESEGGRQSQRASSLFLKPSCTRTWRVMNSVSVRYV